MSSAGARACFAGDAYAGKMQDLGPAQHRVRASTRIYKAKEDIYEFNAAFDVTENVTM